MPPLLRHALMAAALVALAGCAGRATASQGLHPGGYQAGDGAVKTIPSAQRPRLPALHGTDLQGNALASSRYTGDILVINFWASWCAPCVAEAPSFAQLARDLRPDGVRFLGVDFRNDDRGNAQAFEHRYGVGYPSLYDPASSVVLSFPQSVRPVAIPTTEVVDRSGHVAAVIFGGPVLYSTLKALVTKIAAER